MPRPRRSNLSRQSSNARRLQNTVNARTEEQERIAREQQRERMARLRARGNNIDQQINCSYDYSLHPSVCIGKMDVVCKYCGALKFSQETPGLCCLNGKVKLPSLTPPPEPLYSLLCGETQESRHFLANTQKYNGCFQMTSFGADIIEERGFNPTFKIQGQIHHRIGSLLPFEDTQNKFLQIYFMGNMEEQLDRRLEINAE
ncbi:uncharacterized protein LOC113380824 [Ctenocephalides felis]|uniref:uncharacterized protein LOC113380824 n=1 Tax=Ctenocephalides felis TaxID=7515 RepID=UPI000E6E417C|nr:uncharacterized protein LOC113380824 [Ctenocephalides felis]